MKQLLTRLHPLIAKLTEDAAGNSLQRRNPWFRRLLGLALALILLFSLPGLSLAYSFTEYTVPTSNSSPFGITSGPDGNLWFTQYSGNKIGKLTPGGVITEYSLPVPTNHPYAITSGLDGNVWFTNTKYTSNEISVITPDGHIWDFTNFGGGSATAITSGPDGNLWFTDYSGNKIGNFSPNSGRFTEYSLPTSSSQPYGITTGPDGNLWFTEYSGNKIGTITTDGFITEYSLPTSSSQPYGITAGPDGNLWFTEYSGNKIGKITTGGTITEYPIPTANSVPVGITSGSNGNLWFTESGVSGNKIGTITTGGVITEYSLPTSNSTPDGITSGADGNLWFTEYKGNKIGQINPTLPPTVGMSFTPSTLTAGQTTANLTFNLTNPNPTTTLTNLSFGSSLPSGLALGGVSANSCGANLQTPLGSPSFQLKVPSLAGGADCSVTLILNLLSSSPASYIVSLSSLSTDQTGTSSLNTSATLTVAAGPPASISVVSGSGQSTVVGNAFAQPLVAKVLDSNSYPVSSTTVTFTAPASGASGFFQAGTITSTTFVGSTDASGTITSATFIASSLVGSYTVSATVNGIANPASFSLTNTVGPASKLVVVSGSGQSANLNTTFAQPLVARVTDAQDNPVVGASIYFFGPPNGAPTIYFGQNGPGYYGQSDASGLITTTTFTANNLVGSYNVTAQTDNVNAQVKFSVTNTNLPASQIGVSSGSGQSTPINTTFAQPLVAQITDSAGKPVYGVSVSFSAPASGASGTFAGGGVSFSGTSDATGLVTTSSFTANLVSGSYSVSASVSGIATPASFSLTNLAGCNPLVVTSNLDDGSCGTLRMALSTAGSGVSKQVTITLGAGSVITLTSGLTLATGVSITTTATCTANSPAITLKGSGLSSGNGLTLTSGNSVYGLWVRGFSGKQIVAPSSGGNHLRCVKSSKT